MKIFIALLKAIGFVLGPFALVVALYVLVAAIYAFWIIAKVILACVLVIALVALMTWHFFEED